MTVEETFNFISKTLTRGILGARLHGDEPIVSDRDLLFCEIISLMSLFSDDALDKLAERMSILAERGITNPKSWSS